MIRGSFRIGRLAPASNRRALSREQWESETQTTTKVIHAQGILSQKIIKTGVEITKQKQGYKTCRGGQCCRCDGTKELGRGRTGQGSVGRNGRLQRCSTLKREEMLCLDKSYLNYIHMQKLIATQLYVCIYCTSNNFGVQDFWFLPQFSYFRRINMAKSTQNLIFTSNYFYL